MRLEPLIAKKFEMKGSEKSRQSLLDAAMDYMTLKEASEIWGVTPRWINYYCSSGRIPGAVKMGTVWLIPKGAQKPADRRFKSTRSKDGENK